MGLRNRILTYIFTVLLIIVGPTGGVLTILFYDSLIPMPAQDDNFTFISPVNITPAIPVWQKINPVVQIAVAMFVNTLVSGVILIVMLAFFPDKITDRERQLPKKYLVISGVLFSCSSIMFQYSLPGTRTPPYLGAFLQNFYVPVTFVLRFIILRRRPTLRKALCALVIVIASMVSLIPTFIPSLETRKQHFREGGATGAWGIIWPIILVASTIPNSVSKITLETAVKYTVIKKEDVLNESDEPGPSSGQPSHYGAINTSNTTINVHNSPVPDAHEQQREILLTEQPQDKNKTIEKEQPNMIYMLFWNFLSTFVGVVCLFWVDLLPGFGMQKDMAHFIKQFEFNLKCIFGQTSVCGTQTIIFAWSRTFMKTSQLVVTGFLLRYSEGANFNALVVRIPSPIMFTFWTLFEERPFRWSPMIHLSTWLSIGAIVVMLPALIIYDRGPPEVKSKDSHQEEDHVEGENQEERTPLLQDHQENNKI